MTENKKLQALEIELKERVVDFWKNINEKFVPRLVQRFTQREVFGEGVPDLAILEKIKEQIYTDPCKIISPNVKKQRFLVFYNSQPEINEKYGLPPVVTSFKKFYKYRSQLVNARNEIWKKNNTGEDVTDEEDLLYIVSDNYRIILQILADDYAGLGVDFSKDYPQEYFFEAIKNPEKLPFRLEAIKNIKKTNIFNNYYVCLPETYDLILKSDAEFDKDLIKYGLYLAYLDEQYIRSEANQNSRFIFTEGELLSLVSRFDGETRSFVKNSFMAFPFIPERKNRLVRRSGDELERHLGDPLFTSNLLSEIETKINYSIPDYKGIRFNINGSTLVFALSGKTPPVSVDVDIRLDYRNKDEYIPDKEFDKAVKYAVNKFSLQELEKIILQDGEKYKYKAINPINIVFEFYRGSFGFISGYHVPAVRVNYNNGDLHFYPSAAIAWLTGICLDLRYFTTVNGNPMQIVEKYNKRGFTFFLNSQEMALYVEYLAKRDIPGYYVPIILRIGDYEKLFKAFIDNPEIEHTPENALITFPEEFHQNFLRHCMFDVHNKILLGKIDLQATLENLPIPFE